MTEVNRELTENLNNDIRSAPNSAFSFFSERGKRIYFPFKGILGQSAEAKNSKINATIGTASEEDGSPLTLECIEKLINVSPDFFLYTPSFGLPRLRELWKEQILKKNPLLEGKNFSIPVVTSALTHGLNICAYLFVNENDEIIISDLNWDNYELIFRTAFGAKFTYYETFKNNAYNTDGLIQAIRNSSSAKKIVLLNFPNNPAGYSLSKAEALKIKEEFLKLAEEGHNILVIIDDAYFGLFYEDDIFKESLFSLFADLHKNILAVKIDGPTKEDYVWSFRIGFITFAIKDSNEKQLKAFEAKAAGAVRATVSNCSGIAQSMLIKAYQSSDYEKEKNEKFNILFERYKKVIDIFRKNPDYLNNFQPMPFNSGYFMCVKPIGVDAEPLREELLSKYNTGVIVLSGFMRIAFSSVPLNQLDELFSNINQAIKNLKKG